MRSCEEIYISKIENGIRSIRLGNNPEEVEPQVYNSLGKLKNLNDGMYEDLLQKYENVVNFYKDRTPKK
jgi:hypothetical protein